MKLRRILLLGMLGFSLALSAENKKIGYVQAVSYTHLTLPTIRLV